MKPNLLGITTFSAAIAGCASESPVTEATPAQEIEWINREIDSHRTLKLRFVQYDPLERQIEGFLSRDPRVESARVAFDAGFMIAGCGAPPRTSFAIALRARKTMTKTEVSTLIEEACRNADCRIDRLDRVAGDGDNWAAAGIILTANIPNPDVSSLSKP